MKIQFLGTAAAEGFPATFCNCDYCNKARELGKSEYRTRSQTIIDNKLLIDLPADTYMHFLQSGIKGDEIESLIITHSHGDHFYEKELDMRGNGYAKNMKVQKINLLIPSDCEERIFKLGKHATDGFNVLIAENFKTFNLNGYEITSFPARHGYGWIKAHVYLIKKDGKTFFYGHDTGYFYEEIFDYLVKNRVYLNGITLDCCYGGIPISDEGGHMGYDNVERLLKRLEQLGVVDCNTIKIVNHFSHNANPIQSEVENAVRDFGALVSYDGFTVEV